MRLRGHIRLLIIATLVWAGFLVGGLPSYYQQYSTRFMIVFDLVALVLIAVAVYLGLRRAGRRRRLRASLWLAFYFTAPLAIYDWIYCGVYLGHGLEFIGRFWYLSVYYSIPWIVFPLIAAYIRSEGPPVNRRRRALPDALAGEAGLGRKGFEAFSDSAQLARWGSAGFTKTFHEFVFRPGGAWKPTLQGPDGTDFENERSSSKIETIIKMCCLAWAND